METLAPERAARAADKVDARILRALQRDGRISNLKLAEEVHLSPTAALERVKRLQRDGYILGYRARLNPEKLGAGLVVFVEVLLNRTAADEMGRFEAAVHARPEILECHLVAGTFDYLLKARVADAAHGHALVDTVLRLLPGVREVRAGTATREIKAVRGVAA